MDYLRKLIQQVKIILLVTLLLDNIALFAVYSVALGKHTPPVLTVALMFGSSLLFMFMLAPLVGSFVMQPIRVVWHSILHVTPGNHEFAVPKSTVFWLGKDLVNNLTHQVYQLASVVDHVDQHTADTSHDLTKNVIANGLPLPLAVLNNEETVIFANAALCQYINKPITDIINQNVYSVIDMAFSTEQTFDTWLQQSKKGAVTASRTWERVRIQQPDEKPPLLFDLAAYYNKNNPEQVETMLVMFDHSERYSQDDQAVSFVALAVHELRTPLTLLRGYIEVFEQELAGKLDPELTSFLAKMKASSQQLAAFINTILHVARVESDQLELKLQQETWPEILQSAVNDLQLRAKVRGITLECQIADNLPAVGADRTAITEVINNLVDNAVKYSGSSKRILISSKLTQDNLVETTVQDFGVGVPESVVPNLFTKFTRNHRNRSQIGGTGLGLYLSKSIVGAHGGNIWIRSHENEGTTVGFTLLPYASLKASQKDDTTDGIVRGAHGWIKNHSMYRR